MTERGSTILTPQELVERVNKSLRRLKRRMSFEEYHGIFMGKAQLIEDALKNILIHRYKYEEDSLEKYTLGKCIKELKKSNLRKDFISLLEDFLEYRNYIAHEIIVDEAYLRSVMGSKTGRLNFKHLQHGMYLAEQVIHVHDFLFVENEFYLDGRD